MTDVKRKCCMAMTVAWSLVLGLSAGGWAQDAPQVRHLTCPVDGGTAAFGGTQGRSSPRMYSDLEVPTEAYPNLVIACGQCGYANWTEDFERPVPGSVAAFVRQNLAATAKRSGNEPLFAWQHHLKILQARGAGLRERFGATLVYTYVLKRKRPIGGQDHELERQIQSARADTLTLLLQVMKADPPRKPRGKLEWQYLIGELTRLTGDTKHADPVLRMVCNNQADAGYTVGNLACEMADRAARGDTFEEYRDGVFDVAQIPDPRKAKASAPKPPTPTQAQPPSPPPAAEPAPAPVLPPMQRPPPPRDPGSAPQPPAPPPAPGS